MSSGQPGDLVLVLALAMSLLSAAAFLVTALGKRNLAVLAIRAYYVQIFAVGVAVIYLWVLIFSHDFSIEYVYAYSSSDLPFFYLLSAFWGGQEGTYLLWLFLSCLGGLIIIYRGERYRMPAMFFYSLINLFLVIMLLTLSPFRHLDFPVSEGAGLNPLLQDPWMVVHPPVMFVAYALAGVPYALILAVLVRRDFNRWPAIAFPWLAMTSVALGIANVLGGYWAYKTLGWGGYWAWDPVENTSFIPWLVSLGVIHGMLVEKRCGALRRLNIILTAAIFVLVVYGTFLTRSGVLADFSVHSFVDLGANAVLITFVIFFSVLLLAVYFFSGGHRAAGHPLEYDIYGREFILFVGMLILVILGGIVLFWSSLPLLTRYISSNPSAPDAATYNAFAFPLAILICLFLTVSPLAGRVISRRNLAALAPWAIIAGILPGAAALISGWLNPAEALTVTIYIAITIIYSVPRENTARVIAAAAGALVGVAVAGFLGVAEPAYLVFFGAAAAAGVAQLVFLVERLQVDGLAAGGALAHVGYGLMLIGILSSAGFSRTETVILERDAPAPAFNYELTYHGMSGSIMDENNSLLLTVADGFERSTARPDYFYSARLDGIMKRPCIQKKALFDFYLSPREVEELPGGRGLILGKGESHSVDSFTITFVDFKVSRHSTLPAMSVRANLAVTYDGVTDTISPALVNDPSAGPGQMQSETVPLFPGAPYEVSLVRVFADDGMVALEIPGLIEAGPPDRLILDVSVKPVINLLWLGTIIVFIGMIMAVCNRYRTGDFGPRRDDF